MSAASHRLVAHQKRAGSRSSQRGAEARGISQDRGEGRGERKGREWEGRGERKGREGSKAKTSYILKQRE
jgi:hypothetical protein